MLQTYLQNLLDGIYHIISVNAFDHFLIIILLAVVYTFRNWKRIMLLILLITLAHGLVFILTANNMISGSYFTNHPFYFLPIFILGIHNIFLNGKNPGNKTLGILVLCALIFGGFHGGLFTATYKNHGLFPNIFVGLGLFLGQMIVAFFVLFISYICQIIFNWSQRDWVMIISAIITGITIPLITQS